MQYLIIMQKIPHLNSALEVLWYNHTWKLRGAGCLILNLNSYHYTKNIVTEVGTLAIVVFHFVNYLIPFLSLDLTNFGMI